MTLTAYVAAPGFERDLIQDLERAGVPAEHIGTRLFLTDSHPVFAPWAANVWFDVQRVHIASIKDGARQLREIQRNWVLHEDGVGEGVHRRARLIADGLPHVSGKPIRFPNGQPKSPLGSWTLVDASMMLAAARCSSLVGDGAFMFAEDREGPPSRAYLKLWEALTRIDFYPGTGTHCVDLGAAPGGWSWVLAELGAQVTAVDKAPLDPSLVARDSVQFLQESAFGLSPEAYIEATVASIYCAPTSFAIPTE